MTTSDASSAPIERPVSRLFADALEKNNPLLEEAASKIDALEALITKARDALLALRLANENAPTLSLWQQRANANADAVLQAIERHEPANV